MSGWRTKLANIISNDSITSNDRVVNKDRGQGTEKDVREQGYFSFRYVSPVELENMYEYDWLSAAIIDNPIEDMLKNWRSWEGDNQKEIEAYETEIEYSKYIEEWITTGDLYGGAVAFFFVLGQDDISSPLIMEEIGQGDLIKIVILDRHQVTKINVNYFDPLAEDYLLPEFYQVAGAEGQLNNFHPSRAFEIDGIKRPKRKQLCSWDGEWSVSRLARCYTAIKAYHLAIGATTQMVGEANIDVIQEDRLNKALTTEAEDEIIGRASLMARTKSAWNMLVMDKEAVYSRHAANFSGLAPSLEIIQEDASGAAEQPVTKLFGKAKAGMSGDTNDGDIRNYEGNLQKRQTKLKRLMKKPDEIMVRSAIGSYPKGLNFKWNPLSVVTGSEAAKINKDNSDADKSRIESKIVAPEECRSALESDPRYKLNDAAYKAYLKASENENENKDEEGKPNEE